MSTEETPGACCRGCKGARPGRHQSTLALGEKCGVVGVYAPQDEAARLAFFALYALQHRGQESAGICTADGAGLHHLRGMGLVSQVFRERALSKLRGAFAIGHTRYSTTGSSRVENAQPFVVRGDLGGLALGHNGNLVNVSTLRAEVAALGITPRTSTDSELVAHLVAQAPGADWLARIRSALPRLAGAFCLVMLTRDRLFAVRDPWGTRPLALGRLPRGWIVASETCALDAVGASFIREITPGELVAIGPDGVQTEQLWPPTTRAGCSFEYIYFA